MITLRPIDRSNWRATLHLNVRPDQQQFVADYTPPALIVLAKAYIQPAGIPFMPFAIYSNEQMIGLCALSCTSTSHDNYWLYHFLIDHHHQGRGYGSAALQVVINMVATCYPRCEYLNLTVHPANTAAQRLYERHGFERAGVQDDGELLYRRFMHKKDG